MITLQEAIENNPKIASALRDVSPESRELAGALWNAVQGVDGHEAGSFSEALYESAPSEHAVVLSQGGPASSHAFLLAWGMRHYAKERSGVKIRNLAKHVWQKFLELADKVKDLQEGFGVDASDAWETEQDAQQSNLDLSDVREIAELAGRMYAVLKGCRSEQPSQAPEEIYSVTLGSELSRLLPSELAHLGQPTEICLIERIADHRALCYAVRGQDHSRRGPLCIVLDESGSMHGGRYGRGPRFVWSKAAAIALARVAHDDGRPVTVVRYSTHIRVMEMRPGDLSGYVTLARGHLGGGTYTGRALERAAVEIVRMAQKGDRGADAVLITDGGSEDITTYGVEQILKVKANIWSIAIETSIASYDATREKAARYVELTGTDMRNGTIEPLQGAVNPA